MGSKSKVVDLIVVFTNGSKNGGDISENLSSIIGFAIAGIFVMSVWGAFAEAYGIFGGWFAGLMIISIMWFMNHFRELWLMKVHL